MTGLSWGRNGTRLLPIIQLTKDLSGPHRPRLCCKQKTSGVTAGFFNQKAFTWHIKCGKNLLCVMGMRGRDERLSEQGSKCEGGVA